jgi:hypothetical protein
VTHKESERIGSVSYSGPEAMLANSAALHPFSGVHSGQSEAWHVTYTFMQLETVDVHL